MSFLGGRRVRFFSSWSGNLRRSTAVNLGGSFRWDGGTTSWSNTSFGRSLLAFGGSNYSTSGRRNVAFRRTNGSLWYTGRS